MADQSQKIASISNKIAYANKDSGRCIDGAPHIKHGALRELYGRLVCDVYDHATRYAPSPRVLDLGAGEGSVTLPFLALGAWVTAVDVSDAQLDRLRGKCQEHADRLDLRCEDVDPAIDQLAAAGDRFDIVVANSFLHHIPDYLGLIRRSVQLLAPHGQFFSFQDPLRYDTIGAFSKGVSDLFYVSWRVTRGDVIGGALRRLRRKRGIVLDIPEDNSEYHITRNGLDQDAIRAELEGLGLTCQILPYFSSQSTLGQAVCTRLGFLNTFAVIARRQD